MDTKILSKSVKRVQDALQNMGSTFEIKVLTESTRTAKDAAKALNCDVGQIVKTLLFYSEKSKQPVLILASGANLVNEQVISKLVGENILKADAALTKKITGFAIGGVAPIGHEQPINVIFIDEDLLTYELVWAAAGTPHAVFNLKTDFLKTLTGGQVVNIKG
ncbi:MAG: YbaK/EbsC family protein [Candidatus Berkiella sp.]